MKKRIAAITIVFLFITTFLGMAVAPAPMVSVLVQADSVGTAAEIVRSYGGQVDKQLGIIAAVSAHIPVDKVAAVAADGRTVAVHENYSVQVASEGRGAPTVHFPQGVGADQVWAEGITGDGITIAIVDTGIHLTGSEPRILTRYDAAGGSNLKDAHGHGTFMAGIIGNRRQDDNGYIGIAPGARFVDVRVLNEEGFGTYDTVIDGLDWILNNKDLYNIRIVNLSLVGPVESPYWADPVNQAVEALWAAGLTVVAAGGNQGSGPLSIPVPGNNPFVITVGALSDNRTPNDESDDFITTFSSAGPTETGFVKPDVVAPGANVISMMKNNSAWANDHPHLWVKGEYYQAGGTSAATAVTTGIVALMLEQNPELTPNQIKARLMYTARPATYPRDPDDNDPTNSSLVWSIFQQGAGRVKAYDAVFTDHTDEANLGMEPGMGNLYVGPAVYRDGAFRLVDENGDLMEGTEYLSWTGGYDWEPGGYGWTPDGYGWTPDGYGWTPAGYGWTPAGYGWTYGYAWAVDEDWQEWPEDQEWESGYNWSGYGWAGYGWAGYGWAGYGWAGYGWAGYGWAGYGWSGYGWAMFGLLDTSD